MIKLIEDQTYSGIIDSSSRGLIEDVELRHCSFDACMLSGGLDPRLRTTIRNVRLIGCIAHRSQIGPAVLDSVFVDALTTKDPLFVWGAALRHVVVRGPAGRVIFRASVAPGIATNAQEQAFARANRQFYAGIDWALDVTEAEFIEVELDGIPARLVKRDPHTQVVVTKRKAMEGRWRSLDLSRTWWDVSLNSYANSRGTGAGFDDAIVLVAPKRNKRFAELLRGLTLLREAGVAEGD